MRDLAEPNFDMGVLMSLADQHRLAGASWREIAKFAAEPDFYAEANCKGREEFQEIIVREANNSQLPGDLLRVSRLICQMCTVTQECMEYGLRHANEHGMYGALHQRARQQLAKEYGIEQAKRPRTRGRSDD